MNNLQLMSAIQYFLLSFEAVTQTNDSPITTSADHWLYRTAGVLNKTVRPVFHFYSIK